GPPRCWYAALPSGILEGVGRASEEDRSHGRRRADGRACVRRVARRLRSARGQACTTRLVAGAGGSARAARLEDGVKQCRCHWRCASSRSLSQPWPCPPHAAHRTTTEAPVRDSACKALEGTMAPQARVYAGAADMPQITSPRPLTPVKGGEEV